MTFVSCGLRHKSFPAAVHEAHILVTCQCQVGIERDKKAAAKMVDCNVAVESNDNCRKLKGLYLVPGGGLMRHKSTFV